MRRTSAPPRKVFTPRPYQELIIDHQIELPRSATHAGMGMGKTVSKLTVIGARQLSGMGRALVIAPKRVAQSTWPDEARLWDHLSGVEVTPIVGTAKQRLQALRADTAVHSINYENIPWLLDQLKGKWPYHMVVSDESTKLKGFRLRKGTKRAAALAKIAAVTPYWDNLTGSPAPNGLLDLWGQFWFIDKGGRLGRTFTQYRERFFKADNPFSDHPKFVPADGAQEAIQALLADRCLTIRSEDWFPVEAPVVVDKRFSLPTEAEAVYRRMEKEFFVELASGAEIEAPFVAAKQMKCGQIANGFAFDNKRTAHRIHDVKLQILDEIVTELAGAPLLVVYEFVPDRDAILKAFPQFRVFDDDPETLREWNAGKIAGLVLHPASCGHGLNLQHGGHHLAFYSVGTNLEWYEQVIERVGPVRQMQSGYDRNVWVYRILAEGTVDEDKAWMMSEKASAQDAFQRGMRSRS